MNDLTKKKEEAKKVTTSNAVTEKAQNVANSKTSTLEEKKQEISKILQPISAEQRLKNLEHFKKLAEKHNHLKNKSDEVNSFMVSRDGLKEKIVILSDNGNQIEVANSNVIEEVLNVVSTRIEKLLETSEEEILSFAI